MIRTEKIKVKIYSLFLMLISLIVASCSSENVAIAEDDYYVGEIYLPMGVNEAYYISDENPEWKVILRKVPQKNALFQEGISLYVKKSAFAGLNIGVGSTISFVIKDYEVIDNSQSIRLPYQDAYVYICDVKPIYLKK